MNFSRTLWLLAASVIALNAQPPFTLHVYVDDVNQPLYGTVTPTAQHYAGGLLAYAGVRVFWHRGTSRAIAPDVLQIKFAADAPREFRSLDKRTALGISLPYAKDGTPIVLFSDRIASMIESYGPRAGIVLGYVMAHEIGHVLEGVAQHSETGLMRGLWTRADLASMTSDGLPFADVDRDLIRMGVEDRQRRMVLASLSRSSL